MVILCFNCGGQHFARDCPEPDKRWKGNGPLKGGGKGKGDEAKGKGKGATGDVHAGRSVYDFPIAEYHLAKAKGEGKGSGKKGKGKDGGTRRFWLCAGCNHTVAPPSLFPGTLNPRCPNCSCGVDETFKCECDARGAPLTLG